MELRTGETLKGKAGTNSAITFTISGGTKTTSVDYGTIGQGQLTTSAADLLTTTPVAASTNLIISSIKLANTTASPVTGVIFYISGSTSSNQVNGGFTIPANGSAISKAGGPFQVQDSTGAIISTVTITLTGDVTGSGTGSIATTIANNAVTDAKFRQGVAKSVVGVTGNATANTADIQGGTDQVLRVNGANNALAFGAIDISKAAAATGVLQSTGMPALTGDVTNSAGTLSTTIANSAVTNAKMANMVQKTLKGRAATAGTGAPTDLTSTEAAAIPDAATTSLQGMQSAVDKLKEDNMWYDIVAQGGADRTGSVDATAIIQAAIDAVATAGGGIVFIPRGTFKVTAAITITGNFVTVRGASRVASKLVPTHATGNVFTVSGIFNRFEYIRIEPTSFTNRTAAYAIEFTSTASNCGCQWVDILGMWSAIKATGQLCRLEDMNIRECGYGAVNGCMILIDSFTDQYLSKIVCDNGVTPPNAPQATFAGVRITNLSSLLMSDCQIIHCQVGMDVAPASTNTVPSIYCMNTFFDNGTIGAKFVSGSGNIYRSRFIGVWFSSNSTAGVQLNGAVINGLDFIGCEFYGNPIGIEALAATEWGVRASRFAGNTTNAIKTTAGATHSFTISDNVIGNVSGFGANAQGINIQAGTYKRYQILDNRGLESNTTPGVIDLGAVGATDQKNVANNMGAVLKGAIATLTAPLTVPITTETLVLNARIPANGVSVGQVFRFKMIGITSAGGLLTFRAKVGALGTAAGDTQAWISIATAAQIANARQYVEGYVTVRSLGAPGTVGAEGQWQAQAAVNGTVVAAVATTNVTTTADWFIDLTAACATAGTWVVQHAVIEAL